MARDSRLRIGGAPVLPLAVFAAASLLAYWDDSALGVLLPDIRSEFGLNVQFLVALNSAMSVNRQLAGGV